jgi:hypothetical protein
VGETVPPAPDALAVAATAGSEREAEFVENVLAAAGIPFERRVRAGEVEVLVSPAALGLARLRLRLIPDF